MKFENKRYKQSDYKTSNDINAAKIKFIVNKLNSKKINGIANLGIRPTVGGETPVLEVHLLDFNQKIYGETLEVEFIKKVREEQKFLNLQNLKDQIFKDISAAREYFI